ncbi:enoyl-CoA hydratase/isomerase family protein [Pacificimonas sp. WHA3]|uniref:Enoyl-CoA hydratase/isomerase family protein n=1 Tax=Pacificimonas pallii TaxID=2827236 RepID=A0ABS6SAV4_9SPHN|nr:enoyl-CoA hydratase-related protein [Pacificimonas pallii]MBV7255330.1 enoyl-CoA hydratase/isomerase family protein [Pacificimonas pallii]
MTVLKWENVESGLRVSRMGPVAVVQIDRPSRANSLDIETSQSMARIFDAFDSDDTVAAVIITGSGQRHFCAGMDLACVKPGERVILPESGFGGLTARASDKPLIAAVNGVALGGGLEVLLACDLVLAAPHCKFGLPEPAVGQAALAGGLVRLPLTIGRMRAMEMVLTGRLISSARALEWGLANEIVADEPVLDAAIRLASKMAELAPLAQRASKAVMLQSERAALARENPRIVDTMLDSNDAVEGATAFFEKRKPMWTGR